MSDTTKVKEELLDHFTHGAPSYKMANEAVKAKAREEAEAILPLIDKYTRETELQALLHAYSTMEAEYNAYPVNIGKFIRYTKQLAWDALKEHQLTEQKDGE